MLMIRGFVRPVSLSFRGRSPSRILMRIQNGKFIYESTMFEELIYSMQPEKSGSWLLLLSDNTTIF